VHPPEFGKAEAGQDSATAHHEQAGCGGNRSRHAPEWGESSRGCRQDRRRQESTAADPEADAQRTQAAGGAVDIHGGEARLRRSNAEIAETSAGSCRSARPATTTIHV
jgi:hypothetical protein